MTTTIPTKKNCIEMTEKQTVLLDLTKKKKQFKHVSDQLGTIS